jgi:hypothetical protein
MFKLAQYQKLLTAAEQATKPRERGVAFERLCKYLLEALDGVEVHSSNVYTASEEIDLQIWNAGIEPVLRHWGDVFLVECKNWTSRVGAPAVESFIGKLRRRNCKNGLFIAAGGVTGGFAGRGVRGAARLIESAFMQDGIRVLVLTLDDLKAITNVEDLRTLLKRRLCLLYASKVF